MCCFSSVSKRIVMVLIVLVFFLSATTQVSAASRYFDSISGNDLTGDGTIGNPWQTIVKLQEQVQWAQPGDTLYLKKGSSWSMHDLDGTTPAGLTIVTADTGLAFYSSGTSGTPITLTSYGTGTAPTFSNPNRAGSQSEAVFLVQGNNWVIDGVKITASTLPAGGINGVRSETRKGMFLYQTTNTIIRNNEITGVGEGIYIEADRNLLTHNHVHHPSMVTNNDNDSNDDVGAVCIVLSGSQNEVSYNMLEYCQGDTFDFAPTYKDGGALEIYAKTGQPVNDNYIHHNTAQYSEGFMELGGQNLSSADNNIMAYNLSRENTRIFYFNLDGSFPISVTRHRFYHNTVVETQTSLYGYLIGYSTIPSVSELVELKNNIFYFNPSLVLSQTIANEEVIKHSNNVFYSSGSSNQNNSILGFSADATDIFDDPDFVSANNFSLQNTSHAINLGASLGTVMNYSSSTVPLQELDLDGNIVPQHTIADSGAYESAYETPVSPTLAPAPTVSSVNGSSSTSSSVSTSYCPTGVMLTAPDLFQADGKNTSVDLYFAPGAGAYNKFSIFYGTTKDANQYATDFAYSDHSGVIKYTIHDLRPNTMYYFKIYSSVDCSYSSWSNILGVKTRRNAKLKMASSFRYSAPKKPSRMN